MVLPTLNLEHYNPSYVEPLDIGELKSTVFLSILDHTSHMDELNQLAQLFNNAFQPDDDLTLLIYVTADCSLIFSEIEAVLESLEHSAPEIMLLDSKTVFPQDYPGLLKQVDYYISLANTADFHSPFYAALAMDCPVIALDSALNHRHLDEQVAFWLPAHEANIRQWLTEIYQKQHPKIGVRGHLIARLSGLERAWKNNWECANLASIVKNIDQIEVATIVFWGRSGSTFIHSLLDSHPQVLSIGHYNFATLLHFGLVWQMIINNQVKDFSHIIDLFCTIMSDKGAIAQNGGEYLFSEQNEPFKNIFKYYFNKIVDTFNQYDKTDLLETHSRKMTFILIHYAYALALGQDIREKRIIAHQLHWVENMPMFVTLLQDFPQAKFIGMIRDPIKGLYSFLAANVALGKKADPDYTFDYIVYAGYYVSMYRHILIGWKRIEHLLNEPVYAVVLEKLHEDPKKELQKLIDWLGVRWHDHLLKSTVDGQPYHVISGVHQKIDHQTQTFDPQRVNYPDWTNHLDALDNYVLQGLLKKELEAYHMAHVSDFQHIISHLLLLIPTKLERQAFLNALKKQEPQNMKLTALGYAERCYYSYLKLCDYSFMSTGIIWSRLSHDELNQQLFKMMAHNHE